MPESNRLCRWFLFDIVPQGKGKNTTSTGEGHDRIALSRRRVLVNWAPRGPVSLVTRVGHAILMAKGKVLEVLMEIKKNAKKSQIRKEREERNHYGCIKNFSKAYITPIPLQASFHGTIPEDLNHS